MRIDIESTGFRPDYTVQKPSGEVNELNNRGENVRGRIIDVNQNIVLIQTSTGKQFSASTTVPLENFIDQEMSFAMLVGPSGELILVPEIDQQNKKEIIDLKIEDLLAKFGKQATAENKEIIKLMMKSQMPVTKENFDDLKSLKFAMSMLQNEDFAIELEMDDSQKNINDLVKTMQAKKDHDIAKNTNETPLGKDAGIKDLILLKNMGFKVNIENLKNLRSLFSNSSKNSVEGFLNIADKDIISSLKNVFTAETEEKITSEINKNIEDFSFSDMEKINAKNVLFEDFSKVDDGKKSDLKGANYDFELGMRELSKNSLTKEEFEILKNELLQKFPRSKLKLDANSNLILEKNSISQDEIINGFKSMENTLIKTLGEGKVHTKEDIITDYQGLKDQLKVIVNTLGDENEASRIIEKKIMPKLNILSEMAEKYNYYFVPFKVDQNRKNMFQYFEKKGRKGKKNSDNINIGLCLETKNMGNVKTMFYYSKKDGLKIDFLIRDKDVKLKFDQNMANLKKSMKLIGFNNVDINTNVKKDVKNDLLDQTVYTDEMTKSFEMWI